MSEWKLIPCKPTPQMMGAALIELSDGTVEEPKAAAWDAIRAYRAMLSASPPAPDVVGALQHYACNCEPGRCEFANMDDDGTDNVACGYRARAVLDKLANPSSAALAPVSGFNEPEPHTPQYPAHVVPTWQGETD